MSAKTRKALRQSARRSETVVLGQRLRAIRTHYDFTMQQVADALGCIHQNIQRMETGKTNILAVDLHRLARLYEIGIEEFFEKPRVAYVRPAHRPNRERLSENA